MELTEEQKEFNREVSRIRVRVEHAIGSAKFMRIIKEECRLRASRFIEQIFTACTTLHNLRIKIKPWVYKKTIYVSSIILMKVLLPPQYACFLLRTFQIRQWKKEKIFYPDHNNFGLVL